MTGLRVAIAGRRGRGKDTLALALQKLDPTFVKAAFADYLKSEVFQMVEDFLDPQPPYGGGDYEAYLKDRSINGLAWQWWGEWRRVHTSPDYWIKKLDQTMRFLEARDPNVSIVITDMRHHNELQWAHENGFATVRLEGPNHRPDADPRSDDHPSERDVDALPVHISYVNDGNIELLTDFAKMLVLPLAGNFRERREYEASLRT